MNEADLSAALHRMKGEAALRRLARFFIEGSERSGGATDSQRRITYKAMLEICAQHGLETHLLVECLCGQKNRIDKARTFVNAELPICGKCKLPLPLRKAGER